MFDLLQVQWANAGIVLVEVQVEVKGTKVLNTSFVSIEKNSK